MKQITRDKLREILARHNHAGPVGFTSLTPVKLKTGAPFKVFKLSRVHGWFGDYEKSVNRQRWREGADPVFVAKPRSWGEHIALGLVRHQTKEGILKHYLSTQVLRSSKPIYLKEEPPLRPGRRPRLIGVDTSIVAPWLVEKHSQAEAQGVAKEIVHRDVSLDNLSSVALGGELYHLV